MGIFKNVMEDGKRLAEHEMRHAEAHGAVEGVSLSQYTVEQLDALIDLTLDEVDMFCGVNNLNDGGLTDSTLHTNALLWVTTQLQRVQIWQNEKARR